MTFEKFKSLVAKKYPDAEVYPHGDFSRNKIAVAIVFNPKLPKPYKYNGTYCEVLNRLGIKAIYQHDLDSLEAYLERYKKWHGSKNIFTNEVCDYTNDIAQLEAKINDYKTNFVIV